MTSIALDPQRLTRIALDPQCMTGRDSRLRVDTHLDELQKILRVRFSTRFGNQIANIAVDAGPYLIHAKQRSASSVTGVLEGF